LRGSQRPGGDLSGQVLPSTGVRKSAQDIKESFPVAVRNSSYGYAIRVWRVPAGHPWSGRDSLWRAGPPVRTAPGSTRTVGQDDADGRATEARGCARAHEYYDSWSPPEGAGNPTAARPGSWRPTAGSSGSTRLPGLPNPGARDLLPSMRSRAPRGPGSPAGQIPPWIPRLTMPA